ncbi:hypothetical protein EUGRSUZ_A00266 [Eucalyptus grandis]|uniref:Exoribonuclease phosphorolytic domain-containing protein n=2 Tax=Eucalyptus grandis TaxID=71139 RepID=A0A059DBV3_EUCGR|nr:hypothetical protein EUGRSUZ_A00266 [Eucalyptus grandis]
MGTLNAAGDWSSEMEVNAFRRLFPVHYYERHLSESIRPMLDPWKKPEIRLCPSTMLAAIKMEVMTPSVDSPDGGRIVMRPGGPAEVAPVISKQLFDSLLSSGMIDLKELSLIKGKAAWMVSLVILHARSVAAFSHLHILVVSLNDEGRMVMVSEELEGEKLDKEPVDKERRKLLLKSIPFSLTCILHRNYIFCPTFEEESIMETFMTVVLNSSGQLVSLYKPGGPVLAHTSAIQKLQEINEAISRMEID